MKTPAGLSPCPGDGSGAVKRQRLVVCLDGTWNNRDDNTNVLHHFGLIREGDVPDGSGGTIFQCADYHRGVGTGVLDRISGGAFGFGLEQNVRDAYNWLVQNFDEGGPSRLPDEIYIFGFSRGAYTARSLVGFIGRCGLLRRGAPLTVNELWGHYCILGREHEERLSRFEKAFGEVRAKVRQITDLICDPWQIEAFEKMRTLESASDTPDRLPGQRRNDLNETEKLLIRWSRRVRITYLGVYDTVGAMGLDALAIPVLKSKLALHHNMRPTTLIQSCRHALAVDEHRSSFSHTPFVAYVGHESLNEIQEPAASADIPGQYEVGTDVFWKQDWQRTRAMWRRKIEQRWFVGAHSNIGGGYPDNRLAERPFAWVLDGAVKAGLVCEHVRSPLPLMDPLPRPRDSYAEFTKPFSTMLFRSKRYYRRINPPPELRATPGKAENGKAPSGFALENINEQVDASVFEYWGEGERPANLAEYAKRRMNESERDPKNNPRHPWLGSNAWAYVVLALWAALAAAGIAAVGEVVVGEHGIVTGRCVFVLAGVAFAFALVDWSESKASFSLAADSPNPCKRAFLDSIFWTRALGVVLCIVGAVSAFNHLFFFGWNQDDFAGAWNKALVVMAKWWPVPVAAGIGAFVSNLFDRRVPCSRLLAAAGGLLGGPVVAVIAIFAVVLVTGFVGVVVAPVLDLGTIKREPSAEKAMFAGLLLLLQAGVIYFMKSFSWCGEPMVKANLGSIIPLQFCRTPTHVQRRLDDWCYRLTGRQHAKTSEQQPSPECAMCQIVSETLWRDIIGFIPVYFLVLGFGLWFAFNSLEWQWLGIKLPLRFFDVPLWCLIPIATAVADCVENLCHLRYLHLHAQDRLPPVALTFLSFATTILKAIGFVTAAVLVFAAIAEASWSSAIYSEQVGWRGLLAFGVSLAAVAMILLILAAYVYQQWKERNSRKTALST